MVSDSMVADFCGNIIHIKKLNFIVKVSDAFSALTVGSLL